MRVVRKIWGKETILVETELYCSKIISCRDNLWSSGGKFHYHEKKDETFYVLDGTLELDMIRRGDDHVKSQKFLLHKGERLRVYPMDLHRFRSPSCRFLEVSTMDDERDSIRMEVL